MTSARHRCAATGSCSSPTAAGRTPTERRPAGAGTCTSPVAARRPACGPSRRTSAVCRPGGPTGRGPSSVRPSWRPRPGPALLLLGRGRHGREHAGHLRQQPAGRRQLGARSVVAELSTANRDDAMPNVRKDGLEMVFTSNRPGGSGAFDIWSNPSRTSVSDAWGAPVNLGAHVNTAAGETPSVDVLASRPALLSGERARSSSAPASAGEDTGGGHRAGRGCCPAGAARARADSTALVL